jgi:hypothetical protein
MIGPNAAGHPRIKCLSIPHFSALTGSGHLNRHPADAGLAEAEFPGFDGFWQCQFFDTRAAIERHGGSRGLLMKVVGREELARLMNRGNGHVLGLRPGGASLH